MTKTQTDSMQSEPPCSSIDSLESSGAFPQKLSYFEVNDLPAHTVREVQDSESRALWRFDFMRYRIKDYTSA